VCFERFTRGEARDGPLPEDSRLATFFQPKKQINPPTSLLLPYEEQVKSWREKGIQGTTIHQALVRNCGFTGSYSSVRRFLQKLERTHPKATTILEFEPGEAAQVDFGSGPKIIDVFTGQESSIWVFVMTLAWSRHFYAEIVTDQHVQFEKAFYSAPSKTTQKGTCERR
jgi:hypothetical protein